MQLFLGSPALSPFRLEQLLKCVKQNLPQCQTLTARYIYVVKSNQAIAQQQIETLLQASAIATDHFAKTAVLFTVPRVGTQSPWSSKTLDIFKVCGLADVTHIERGIVFQFTCENQQEINHTVIAKELCDPLTESLFTNAHELEQLFKVIEPNTFKTIPVLAEQSSALESANRELGLALSQDEIDYLVTAFTQLKRDPTDVELMMFAQANSEHCRHKIFNASWTIDGAPQERSLFQMIRYTYQQHPDNIYCAYEDNAAIIQGANSARFFADPNHVFAYHNEEIPFVIKVETHNHPTAISPFPGAATGSGGEIRDEAATGRGAKAKAGLCGFSVSNLKIPGCIQAWEVDYGKPKALASALDIMLEGPIGAASFNNEFGRPNLCGYFRTYEQSCNGVVYGYHKPIMIAGGLGNIRPAHLHKKDLPLAAKIIVLGGPSMLIGLGGGAASSVNSGQSSEALDFASVQRSNPEMQRRAQEVIDQCCALGDANPILSIHDVGAGGLSNAIPEIVHGSERGGALQLRSILNAEPGMSPLAIWCNESQERYVLAIAADKIALFEQLVQRERCPMAVVGEVTENQVLTINDSQFNNHPVDLSLSILFGKPPKITKSVKRGEQHNVAFSTENIALDDALTRILQLPTVADKTFLITIGDRSVGGLVARDQLVGPWQIPVADAAVTASSFEGYYGEAMAMGERTPVALVNPAAAGRLAIGEAITNIASAAFSNLSDVKLSANWMAACGIAEQDLALFDTVKAVAMELCPALGLVIPVGKDSLSMRSVWQEQGQEKSIVSPLSLIISGFAKVTDIRKTLTPELQTNVGESVLLLIDLGFGQQRLGGSALAQVYNAVGDECPDLDDPDHLKHFFGLIQALNQQQLILAYHDRSDGGAWATLCEMAFAAHCGLTINVSQSSLAYLCNEELGAVIQVKRDQLSKVRALCEEHSLSKAVKEIATLNGLDHIVIQENEKIVFSQSRVSLQQLWSRTSNEIRKLRDNPSEVESEQKILLEKANRGLSAQLTFTVPQFESAFIHKNVKPKVAILREQGVNGQIEMAAAFTRAGFTAVDVHMTDLLAQRVDLKEFAGLAACGGFSYGDVLGAGRGWAQSILGNAQLRDAFSEFFQRKDTFTLGVCNGCQMLSNLSELIPGAQWPLFKRNRSEQFEARLVMVELQVSPSIFFKGMTGSRLPVVISHGEGRAEWSADQNIAQHLVAMRYVDSAGKVSEQYPYNPNGSPEGITALTTEDGRAMILMPHPERVFRTSQLSWHPKEWQENSPWLQLFLNARYFVD